MKSYAEEKENTKIIYNTLNRSIRDIVNFCIILCLLFQDKKRFDKVGDKYDR